MEYDKEKYKEMILDAAETVLGYFGFNRAVYGNEKNISKRNGGGWKDIDRKGKEISKQR